MANINSPSTFEQTERTAEADANAWVDEAGQTVQDAASSVRDKASKLSQAAGDKAKAAADYFRDRGFDDVVSDLRTYVREHPTQALAGAAALGFTLAMLMRRR
jgi:ElaB/YqjD/DUF883 family membrane-anchored ribosome-binding protein